MPRKAYAAVLDIRPRARALVGWSPTSSSLRSEAWPAARASSLVLRSRGRLVDDAQRLTSDKDFSVHVERCRSTWFERLLPVLVVYAVTIVTHTRKYAVGRRRLRCSALKDAFLPVFMMLLLCRCYDLNSLDTV